MEYTNASCKDPLRAKDGSYPIVIRLLNKIVNASGNSNAQNINISKHLCKAKAEIFVGGFWHSTARFYYLTSH
jgi:hypothetical protein